MEASFLEGSDHSLTGIQAQGVASAAPKEDIPHGLLGPLQRLLLISVVGICLAVPQGRQCLCCLQTASHDMLVAALQPSQALSVAFQADNLAGTKQGLAKRLFQ